jgi:hypothetical protein
MYDLVSHLETDYNVWLKLCNTYEGSSEIKSSHKNTYNRQYQTFAQKLVESLDDCFVRFEFIVSSLCSSAPLAYSDNECAKQLLYALDYHVLGIKITTLEESTDFATLYTEKSFNKLKSHKLSRKYRPNHNASLTSKTLVTSARVGGHDAARGRSSTSPISTTTPIETTPTTKTTIKRSTASETTTTRSSRRSCPNRVLS